VKQSLVAALIILSFTAASFARKQQPHFKVEVKLVSLEVEVLDALGQAVPNLERGDFTITENGAPVEITNFSRLSEVPVSLVISLGTAFMPQSSLGIAKNAISLLIHLLKPGDEICLYSFDQRNAYLEQGFTQDRAEIIAALENIGVPSRSRRPRRIGRSFITPPQIGLGIDLGLAAAKKGANQRKAVLLIRDHPETLRRASIEHVHESGVSLISLGFSEESNSRLILIKEQSGSEQVMLGQEEVSASDEDGDAAGLCRTIVHLLSSHYGIVYQTALSDSQAERTIQILVPGHSFRILSRRTQ
jgi:VWFA-related protein